MNALARISFALLRGYSRVAPTERGGYRLARLARRLLPREQWRSTFSTPDGLRLGLDLGTYPDACMAFGLYELDTYRQIRSILKPAMHFVDCGANIGYFTMLAARVVGPAGRVDAYEPDPLNRQRLEAHLRDNRLSDRVRIRPVGVGDAHQRLTLYHPTAGALNHGSASIYPGLIEAPETFTIDLVRLDQDLDHAPDLVKMDIEGAELSAIRGMQKLLAGERPPTLLIESNPSAAAAAGHRPGDLLRALFSMQPRYRAYWVARRLCPLASPEDLDALGRQVNLLVRAE